MESPAVQRYYRSWEKKRSVTRTFSSEVTRMVKDQFSGASAFYLPAGIDKRTYHKIRADYLYRPSRDTAVKCCLGLGLDAGEGTGIWGVLMSMSVWVGAGRSVSAVPWECARIAGAAHNQQSAGKTAARPRRGCPSLCSGPKSQGGVRGRC